MTAPESQELALAFPGSHVLSGWWKSLEAYRPQALWVAHLLLHRLEVPVQVRVMCRLEAALRLLLQALAGAEAASSVADLSTRMHLDRRLLCRLLGRLQANGLAAQTSAHTWHATPLGNKALMDNEFPLAVPARRTFTYVERPAREPHFLNLARPPEHATAAAHVAPLGITRVSECLEKPEDWKRRHMFPQDVMGVCTPSADATDPAGQSPEWKYIAVDRHEGLVVALVAAPGLSEADGPRFLGFECQPLGWSLSPAPLLCLESGGSEVFSGLAFEPSADEWRQALREFGAGRGLPPGEIERWEAVRQDHRLLIRGRSKAAERGRLGRGETWILAGRGRVRAAARLEFASS